jgi:hypothetical protein
MLKTRVKLIAGLVWLPWARALIKGVFDLAVIIKLRLLRPQVRVSVRPITGALGSDRNIEA